MSCPPEISEILTDILGMGLLRIRSFAWSARSAECAIEADHIHNLPRLISAYSVENLRYYWSVERPAYRDQMASDQLAGWEPLWERLRQYTEPLAMAVTTR